MRVAPRSVRTCTYTCVRALAGKICIFYYYIDIYDDLYVGYILRVIIIAIVPNIIYIIWICMRVYIVCMMCLASIMRSLLTYITYASLRNPCMHDYNIIITYSSIY